MISETVCRAKTDDQPPPPSTPTATPLQRYVTPMTLCALVSQSTTQLHKEKKASHQIHYFFDKSKGIDFEAVTNDFHNFYIVHKLSSSRTEEEYTRWRMSTGFEHLDRYVLSEYFSIVTLQYDFQAKIKDAPNE